MSASVFVDIFCCIASYSPSCCQSPTLAVSHSQFLSPNSIFKLKKQSFLSNTCVRISRTQKRRSSFVILAAQSNFFKVLQTAWKVGNDGIEAGSNLVPNSVPRPIARISVTIAAFSVSFFVLSSLISTAFFLLATVGLAYFAFVAFNKDEGSKDGGTNSSPMEDPVEEARKIMETYK